MTYQEHAVMRTAIVRFLTNNEWRCTLYIMKRTQLYIDEGLFHRLISLSREKKTTISDLVRKAIEKVYGRKGEKKEFLKALEASAGIWKNRTDLPSTGEYVRSLRKSTRWKRLGLE